MSQKMWVGNAVAIYDVWTLTLSGSVTSQTYSLTINNKSITYTASGTDTVSTILLALQNVWNSVYPAAPPEFQELTAAALPTGGPYTSLTLTQKTAGKPTTIGFTSGGSATCTSTNTTPATGPNHFNNAQNWSTGTAPANGDTLIFASGNVPCKYATTTTLTGVTVNIFNGYSGTIGLPMINSDSTNKYLEYRGIFLQLAGGTIQINSANVTRVNIASITNALTVRVLNCGQRPDSLTPVILIAGGTSGSTLDITKGDVGIGFYPGYAPGTTFGTILMSYANNANSDANLYCDYGSTLTTITKNGGNLTTTTAVTSLVQNEAGGTTTIVDGAVTILEVLGGTCNYNSAGTLGTLIIANGASVSFDGDPRPLTVSATISMYGDKSTISDNQKRINAGSLTVQLEQIANLGNISHGIGSLVVAT